MSVQHRGIYVRVSTPKKARDGFSLGDQRDKLAAYAEEQGWTWELFEDSGISGETLDGRKRLVEMLEAAEEGRIVGVLVQDESRLARDDVVAALIRDRLQKAGAKLAMPGKGELDLGDASSALAAGLLGQVAAFEQKLRTEKMKVGLRRTAEAGYWPGGPAPYGYRLVANDGSKHKRLVIDDDEAAVLRLVRDLLVTGGHSTYSAAA